jgi:hypothetical protein
MCDGIIPPEQTELCSVEVFPLTKEFPAALDAAGESEPLSFMKHPWRRLLRTTPMVTLDERFRIAALAYFSDQAATSINSGLNVL